MLRTVNHAFCEGRTNAVLAAWIECFEETCEAFMMLIENGDETLGFDTQFIKTNNNKQKQQNYEKD
jgi:hypothetical protein